MKQLSRMSVMVLFFVLVMVSIVPLLRAAPPIQKWCASNRNLSVRAGPANLHRRLSGISASRG